MFENNGYSDDVLSALKKTSKGQLIYDRHWKEERRTKEIMNDVKLKTSSLTISPKSLSMKDNLTKNVNKSKPFAKYDVKVIERSLNDSKLSNNSHRSDDNISNKTDQSFGKNCLSRPNDSVTEYDLILYEKQRRETVFQESNKKKQSLENEFKKCDEEFDEEMKLIRQKSALEAIKRINTLNDDYKALKDSIHSKQKSFEDNSSTTTSKLKEIESKHQMLVETQRQKQTEIRRKQIQMIQEECGSAVKNCVHLLNGLESDLKNDQYFQILKQQLNSLIGFLKNINKISTKPDLNEPDINYVHSLKQQINGLKDKIVSDIELLKRNTRKTTVDYKPIVEPIKSDNSWVKTTNSVSNFVDESALKEFLKLQQISNEFEKSFKTFSTENNFKQKRNELQLFVKTTINTISCESVEHIRDKLNRFSQLFSEKNVEYGDKQIRCNQNDGSLLFCMSLASKMFISVSTKQKDIALTMAPIIVLLWHRFPTFGQIFMAQMQEKCPYLVPYYPKKGPDDTEDNYLIACGYNITKDGVQEPEDSFLNRMRAMVKLYAAIIQSNVETGHPHGLNYGWIWLARLLNLEPRPAITAAVLESFISVTAHKLYGFYGKQFIKLIDFIQNDYIKRIENVTQKTTKRQSLVKLQMYIEDLRRKINRRADYKQLIPEGVIPDYFFQPSYSNSRGFSFNN